LAKAEAGCAERGRWAIQGAQLLASQISEVDAAAGMGFVPCKFM